MRPPTMPASSSPRRAVGRLDLLGPSLPPRSGSRPALTRVARSQLPLARLILALLLPLAACASTPPAQVVLAQQLRVRGGAVACVEREAARVGAEVLAEGGNAVDAAVATALALAVTWPPAGNLGGGGMATLALPDGTTEVIDFRETAPAAVDIDLFLDDSGRYDPALAEHPWRNIGVPGSVAGLHLMHRRHGRLPWPRLVAPAVALARDGFPVDPLLAAFFEHFQEPLASGAPALMAPGGFALRAGQILRQPELAQTLSDLATQGPRSFYEGPRAQAMADAAAAGGGFLSVQDLASYRAVVREPLTHSLGAYSVLAPPPPSAGGVLLAMVSGVVQQLGWQDMPPSGADELHLWTEASRRAFAQRARWLGDPDSMPVGLELLLSRSVLQALAHSIDMQHATPSEQLGPTLAAPEPCQTTHLSVLDAEGGAVSLTTTLESAFGSKVMAPGTGVLLNNELRDFNRWPGMTTRAGLVGTGANLARPGRRPLSSIAPVVVLDADGHALLVTGSPGGRTIPSTVGRILLEVLLRGVTLPDAVDAPRVHHGWFPDRIDIEAGALSEPVLAELRARGHALRVRPVTPPLMGTQGAAHSVARQPDGTLVAVGDRRREGWAAGVDG